MKPLSPKAQHEQIDMMTTLAAVLVAENIYEALFVDDDGHGNGCLINTIGDRIFCGILWKKELTETPCTEAPEGLVIVTNRAAESKVRMRDTIRKGLAQHGATQRILKNMTEKLGYDQEEIIEIITSKTYEHIVQEYIRKIVEEQKGKNALHKGFTFTFATERPEEE